MFSKLRIIHISIDTKSKSNKQDWRAAAAEQTNIKSKGKTFTMKFKHMGIKLKVESLLTKLSARAKCAAVPHIHEYSCVCIYRERKWARVV